MKKKNEHDTEKRILLAAKDVFHKKGYYGARMQDIADTAGINKAMLHYYYRSKEKLFDGVFEEASEMVVGVIARAFSNEGTFEEKIKSFVTSYLDLLKENQYIPAFVLNEINQRPERIKQFVEKFIGNNSNSVLNRINAEMKKGNYKDIPPNQIIITLISSCIFPFVSKPMIMELFKLDEDGFLEFIEQRKTIIPEIILNGIKK